MPKNRTCFTFWLSTAAHKTSQNYNTRYRQDYGTISKLPDMWSVLSNLQTNFPRLLKMKFSTVVRSDSELLKSPLTGIFVEIEYLSCFLKVAEVLKARGVSLAETDENGCIPMHYAALKHQPSDLAKFYIGTHLVLHLSFSYLWWYWSCQIMMFFCRCLNLEIIKYLIMQKEKSRTYEKHCYKACFYLQTVTKPLSRTKKTSLTGLYWQLIYGALISQRLCQTKTSKLYIAVSHCYTFTQRVVHFFVSVFAKQLSYLRNL